MTGSNPVKPKKGFYKNLFKKLTKKIDLVHFNDSKDGFESSRDRHENLGKGNIPKSGVVAVTNSGVVELVNRQSFQDTFINDL